MRSEEVPSMRDPSPLAADLVIGGALGATWAAALRAYMVEISGDATSFSWSGTFGGVLAPGAISGSGLALARRQQRRGAPRAWVPSMALISLAVLPMARRGALTELLRTGIGGGAIGAAAALLLGGYGLGELGPRPAREAALAGSLLLSAGVAATVPGMGGPEHALTTPRGAWGATLALGLMLAGSLATAVAFRRPGR